MRKQICIAVYSGECLMFVLLLLSCRLIYVITHTICNHLVYYLSEVSNIMLVFYFYKSQQCSSNPEKEEPMSLSSLRKESVVLSQWDEGMEAISLTFHCSC
jgi:hypothetical protein